MNKLKSVTVLFFIVIMFSGLQKIYAGQGNQAKVVDHLGSELPLNLKFKNSLGKTVELKDLVNKPTIFDFVYYRCTGICTPLMVEVATVINKAEVQPGKDYRVISISINPKETPEIAAQKKNAMLSVITKKFAPSDWEFLTGDSVSINKITDAAGFYFKKLKNGYLHKGVLIFVDKKGKICRYLRPQYTATGDFSILPADFQLAVQETSKGQVVQTINAALQTCTTFIPKGKDVLIFGLIGLTGIFTIVIALLVIKKSNPNKGNIN